MRVPEELPERALQGTNTFGAVHCAYAHVQATRDAACTPHGCGADSHAVRSMSARSNSPGLASRHNQNQQASSTGVVVGSSAACAAACRCLDDQRDKQMRDEQMWEVLSQHGMSSAAGTSAVDTTTILGGSDTLPAAWQTQQQRINTSASASVTAQARTAPLYAEFGSEQTAKTMPKHHSNATALKGKQNSHTEQWLWRVNTSTAVHQHSSNSEQNCLHVKLHQVCL